MEKKWLIILVFILLLLCIFLILSKTKKEQYTSNSIKNDMYIMKWHDNTFTKMPETMIKYFVTYHYMDINKDFKYDPSLLNIIIDGEPKDISDLKTDIVISTKKINLPRHTPNLFVPYFVWAFVEKKSDPEILVKKYNEAIPRKTKFCCFMYSNCDENFEGVINRKNFLKLMNKMTNNRVDNLGRCYNDNYKENGTWTDGHRIYNPYKFVIAFENSQIPGYVSEKLINPMISRAIPIYLGAPDVSLYFNKKSFIDVSDFESFEDCINYVLKVDKDDNLYNQILQEPYLYNNEIDKNLFSIYYGGDFYTTLYNLLTPYNLEVYVSPAKIYKHNVKFITFADGKKFKSDRILKEAKDSNFFKDYKAYSPLDFSPEFKAKNMDFILKNKRGYGYWLWKPFFILETLKTLQDGDYLIYLDSGSEINPYFGKRIQEYYKMLETYDVIYFKINYDEKQYTKRDIFEMLNGTDTKQIQAGSILLKKNQDTLNFINDWYNIGCNYHNIDDSPSILPNFPEFIEHRHDQSIFSLLVKQYKNGISVNDNFENKGKNTPFIFSRLK